MRDEFSNLEYMSPQRGLWNSLFDSIFAPKNSSPNARRPETKEELERRQAALFAFARASVSQDPTLSYAMVPNQQHAADAVLRTGNRPFAYEAVQLKEIAPTEVNPKQTLDHLLESIAKRYGPNADLKIAIHLNRDTITELGRLTAPPMPSAQFWLYGLCGRNRGFIVINPFSEFIAHEFDIPKPPSSMTDW